MKILRSIFILFVVLKLPTHALGQSAAASISTPAWSVTSAPARYVVRSTEGQIPPSLSWVYLCFPEPQWATMPIRVFTDTGIAVGSEVLWTAPNGPTLLLFDSSSGATLYDVYVGSNWPSMPIADAKAGVWIETRLGDGKSINRLTEMLQAWSQSRTILGRALDMGIGEGGNRFGPQANLFEHFQGWFKITSPEHLELTTTSVDASFVLVDGQEVVDWPGTHDWTSGPSGPPCGAIDLRPGIHALDYYNAYALRDGGNTPRICSLAVRGGALDQWTPLWSANSFFRPVMPFSVWRYELQGTSVGTSTQVSVPVLSIVWWPVKESMIYTDLPDIGFIEMYMLCLTPLSGTISWTFDDGSIAQGVGVHHVFARSGFRTVHVSLNKGGKEIAWLNQTLSVHADWTNVTQPQLLPEHEADIIGRNPMSLSASDLVSSFDLFAYYLKLDDVLKLLPAVLAKIEKVNDADLPYVKDATLYLVDQDWAHTKEETQLLQALVDRSASAQPTPQITTTTSECHLALARLILKTSDHNEQVDSEIAAIKASTLTGDESRDLAILQGDLLLAKGDVEGARSQYLHLTGEPSGPDTRSSIRLTAKLGQARAFIEGKDFDAAEDELNETSRDMPIEKLSPDWALTRLRLYQAENLPVIAYLWAQRLLPVITESGRSELLFRLTDLAFAQGDTSFAQKTLGELLEKYPYSEEAAQAKARWPGLK